MADHESDFRAWVDTTRTPLRRTAYLLCLDWHLADDLVQDTLTRMYAVWPRVARTGHPTAYARKVLLRRFLDHRRRPARRETSVADVSVSGTPAVVVQPDLGEREHLHAALRRVPPGQRAVLLLRYWEDLSVEQTAAVLGRSSGHVKSQASRGLATLRLALADLDRPEPASVTTHQPAHQPADQEQP